jgi:predicted GH43/DUF377 family glycosyl hydrolase
LFNRDSSNPLIAPRTGCWWEARGTLNPGILDRGDRIDMLYRAVGIDGLSRFGHASSTDGRSFERGSTPAFESQYDDVDARLGIEDPRITQVEGRVFVTYTKAAVESADTPPLSWEPAPFRVRPCIAETNNLSNFQEIRSTFSENAKDLVLFPERINGQYVGLLRRYPSVQLITSPDLVHWSERETILTPLPGGWEEERVGAGPPPIRTQHGWWLALYHANEFLRKEENRRFYRMGMAVLDGDDPSRVIYRHPHPIFEPEAEYEVGGPVGNVVFGTGLVERGHELWLYYGGGDGVVCLATVELEALLSLIPDNLRG